MPTTVLTRQRSWIALLAIVAMVASAMAIGPLSASAATTPSNPATYSACVGPATADAGFTDSAASFATEDINCIFYYGVTKGTSATTYSPGGSVTRWQMALFLTRAAGPAGIVLGDGSDQGFTDISGLDAATQKAINQLKQLGITQGTTATTYSPDGTVTRQQMALFIARFLDDTVKGPGGTQPKGITPTTSDFTDLGSVTVEANNAILDLFHLGVTKGATATTFSPLGTVTRAQMAAFIGRALAHSNARPAGVIIQTDAVDGSGFGAQTPALSVTHRDSAFQPVPNTLIDVFEFTAGTGLAAFNSDGTCKDTANVATAIGTACTLDSIDLATDANGNLATIAETVASGGTVTYYAWTGSTGTVYDDDVQAANNVTVTSLKSASHVAWTVNSPNAKFNATETYKTATTDGFFEAEYGTTQTVTLQLKDAATGDAVAKSGVSITVTDERTDGTVQTAFTADTLTTDAAGQATYPVTIADPTGSDDAAKYVLLTFSSTGSTVVAGVAGTADTGGAQAAGATDDDVGFKFDDTAAAAETLLVAQASDYSTASDSGSGATHTATGTLYDQYGNTMSNVGVAFKTDSPGDELLTPVTRFTNASGVATIQWARDDATSESDTLEATVGAVNGDKTLTVYWVLELADAGNSGGAVNVAVWDGANDAVVYNSGGDTWEIAYYDSNDQFILAAATTYALFDAAVVAEPTAGTYTQVNVTTYVRLDSGVSAFDLD